MTELTEEVIAANILRVIGEENFDEFYYVPHRRVLLSEVKMVTMSCGFCGVEVTGLREDVYTILAQHDYGHGKEVEGKVNIDNDDEGGQVI